MRFLRLVLPAASLACLLAASPRAAAQDPTGASAPLRPERLTYGGRAAEPPQSAWEAKGLLGLEVQLRGFIAYAGGDSPVQAPGLYPTGGSGNPTGTILNPASCAQYKMGDCTPYGIDPFAPGGTVGWRFRPWMSVGLSFAYLSYNAQNGTDTGDAPDSTSQLSRSQWMLGAYLRYYATWVSQRLQPWAEIGVAYSNDHATYARGGTMASIGQPETSIYDLTAQGIAAPLAIGLDWRLAPIFSVGPMLGYAPVFGHYGCVHVDVDKF